MAVTLPSIGITFTQKATSLMSRSERGIAILIVRDATDTPDFYTFKAASEVPSTKFTATNYQCIQDVFAIKQPHRVCVVRIGESGTVADATAIIESNISTGWVTIADGTPTDFTALVTWIGATEALGKTYKALVHDVSTSPDKKHVVNFANAGVVFADETRGVEIGEQYLPSLLGLLAGSNVLAGVTNAKCSNLTSVPAVYAPATFVAAGKFILVNDVNGVYVGVGVNSLTTTNGTTLTEDMKYIETVEAMDLISDDIRDEFKNNYVGKYKNSYDNQILLIAAIRDYFNQLARQNILDIEYANIVDINVSAQRAAWVAAGKTEAAEWTDVEVKRAAYKRTVHLTADVKILGSMEHLTFEINMA